MFSKRVLRFLCQRQDNVALEMNYAALEMNCAALEINYPSQETNLGQRKASTPVPWLGDAKSVAKRQANRKDQHCQTDELVEHPNEDVERRRVAGVGEHRREDDEAERAHTGVLKLAPEEEVIGGKFARLPRKNDYEDSGGNCNAIQTK